MAVMGRLRFFGKAYRAVFEVDVLVDVGDVPLRPTTVLDLTVMPPLVVREGAGDASMVM